MWVDCLELEIPNARADNIGRQTDAVGVVDLQQALERESDELRVVEQTVNALVEQTLEDIYSNYRL